MIFTKGDKATISGQEYICIIADEQYAILAERQPGKINFENISVYSNYDSWEENIIGLEAKGGLTMKDSIKKEIERLQRVNDVLEGDFKLNHDIQTAECMRKNSMEIPVLFSELLRLS